MDTVIYNNDLRDIIESYMDTSDLVMFIQKFPNKKSSGKIKQKEAEMKKLFHWHKDKMCDLYIPLNELSSRTKENLTRMETIGYQWDKYAHIWLIERGNQIPGKDIVIRGYYPDKGFVIYSRHETRNAGSGSTMLIWDEGKKRLKIKISSIVNGIL